MTDSIFLAALKCCEEMAEIVGDEEHHQLYADAYAKGAARADELMFDGEYYIQVQKEIDKYKYQFGKGCLSDQLLGQFLAYMPGFQESRGCGIFKAHLAQSSAGNGICPETMGSGWRRCTGWSAEYNL